MSRQKIQPDAGHSSPVVEGFVSAVRRRLNRHVLLASLVQVLFICGIVMLGLALARVLTGHRVPWTWYGLVAAGGWLATLVVWWSRRISPDLAARRADDHFGLKDAVRSCRNFSRAGSEGGFFALQADRTGQLLAGRDPATLRFRPDWPKVWLGSALALIAVALGFKPPSRSVIEREELAQATLAATTDLKAELAGLVDQLELELDDDTERELVNPSQLREWVEELEATGDPREAMREFARIERQVQQAADALRNRRDEQLLDRAAAELKKDEANRDLGELLKQKKYDAAADRLAEMKPEPAREGEPRKTLSEQRKELAKLKAAARRMADSARSTRNSNSSAGQNNNDQAKSGRESSRSSRSQNAASRGQQAGDSSNPKADEQESSDQSGQSDESDPTDESDSSDPSDDSSGGDDSELDEMLLELDESLEELDEALGDEEPFDGELVEGELSEDGEPCEECMGRVAGQLDELGQRLRKMARQRGARSKLEALARRIAGSCSGLGQSGQSGQSSQRSDGGGVGGLEAGTGSSDRERSDDGNPDFTADREALKGLKGDGPSLTRILDAESGSGTSSRGADAVQRDYQRQFESYVEREDIPEDLKAGVRNYFLRIHQTEEPPADPSSPPSPLPSADSSPRDERPGPDP